MASWIWHDLFNCCNSSSIWKTITYSSPCLCALDFSFPILASHSFSFYVMSLEIFPNHVTNVPESVWILIFISGIFLSASTVLINIDSIALGRLFMKMLKDLGDRPAELQAKYYSFWRWNHWITTFSLSWYPLDISFIIQPSFSAFIFFCCLTKSLCISFPFSWGIFSQLRTEDRNRKMPCEVWLFSVSHCLPASLLDPISPASLLCC